MEDRTLQYYLCNHASNTTTWMVIKSYDEIFEADKTDYMDLITKSTEVFKTPTRKELAYVYTSHLDDHSMLTIIQDTLGVYYKVKNIKLKQFNYLDSRKETLINLIYRRTPTPTEPTGERKIMVGETDVYKSTVDDICTTFLTNCSFLAYTNKELKSIGAVLYIKGLSGISRAKLIERITCVLEKERLSELSRLEHDKKQYALGTEIEELCQIMSGKLPSDLTPVQQLARKQKLEQTQEEYFEIQKCISGTTFEVISSVTKSTSLKALINNLTGKERSKLCIKNVNNIIKKCKRQSKGVISSDLSQPNLTVKRQCELWANYVNQCKSPSLEIIGFYNLSNDVLKATPRHAAIEINIINSNIESFDWLVKFNNLRGINITACYQMNDIMFDSFCQYVPTITSLALHNCYNMTARSLLSVSKLLNIDQLWFEDEYMQFKSDDEAIIGIKEWNNMKINQSLTKLLISSKDVNPYILSPIVERFPNLGQLVIDDDAMVQVHQHTIGSQTCNSDKYLVVQSIQQPDRAFKLNRPIIFTKMHKLTVAEISDTMLKVINTRKDQLMKENKGLDIKLEYN